MSDSIRIGKIRVLKVGETFHLKTGKDHIVYGGMLSEDVYTIVQMKAKGYQGYAWPLYYSKKMRDITIDNVPVYVERVSPQEIEIRI